MVKKTYLLLSFICLLVISCDTSKKVVQANQEEQITLKKTKWNKKEALYYNFWLLLESYTQIYSKSPQNATDLMIFIERSNEDYQMINENVFQFLKKNKNNLIFFTSVDSVTTIYNGKIEPNRVVTRADFVHSCDKINMAQVNLFDEQGYWFRSDSLSGLVAERLKTEYWKHLQETKEMRGNGITYSRTILEYTPAGLKDLCNNKPLKVEQSKFFKNTYNFLDSLAFGHNISRITAPGFIDN